MSKNQPCLSGCHPLFFGVLDYVEEASNGK